MTSAAHARRVYDHRLRDRICRNEDLSSLRQLRIPRSTRASWKARGPRPVVTLDAFDDDRQQLLDRIDCLERRLGILTPIVRLLFAIIRASGFRLCGDRLPLGDTKSAVLRAIASAKRFLPLGMVLKIVRMPVSRYHAWRRAAVGCGLDDRSACPRSSPQQLSLCEVAAIKEMVLDPALRHLPLRSLSLHAQRIGRVFASVSTWARLIRQRRWLRPRHRVYPDKPTLGVRATKPNELWHLDVTILRLLDGTKAYIHAVIDNYSRRILAWTVASRLEPAATCQVLVAAKRHLEPATNATKNTVEGPLVYSDSGVENVNHLVQATLVGQGLRLVLAQVEVTFSNSMIEAFWRSLKHQWLYLNPLDSLEHIRKLVAFFVDEYNTRMPHSAFRGHTPDEIYFGSAKTLEDELGVARKQALQRRMEANRAASCHRCQPETAPPMHVTLAVTVP